MTFMVTYTPGNYRIHFNKTTIQNIKVPDTYSIVNIDGNNFKQIEMSYN